MQNRSRNVDRSRVLYEPVNIVGESGKTLGEDVESLHDLCRVHLVMLIDVRRQRSLLCRCLNVGLC